MNHRIELQTTDVELAVCMGPGTRNLGIPHVSASPLRVKNDAICHVTRQNQYNPAGGGATTS